MIDLSYIAECIENILNEMTGEEYRVQVTKTLQIENDDVEDEEEYDEEEEEMEDFEEIEIRPIVPLTVAGETPILVPTVPLNVPAQPEITLPPVLHI